MTRSFLWTALVLISVTGGAASVRAQTAPTDSSATTVTSPASGTVYRTGLSDRVTTVPLPNGRGVFYIRSGTPGGVRIRSRSGSPAPADAPAEDDLARDVATGSGTEPLTRADLLRMELALRRDLDNKLSQLVPLLGDRSRSSYTAPSGSPPYVIPSGQAPGTLVIPRQGQTPGTLPFQAGTETSGLGVSPAVSPATAEEVERAILETGLFRTTTINFEFNKVDLLPSALRTLDVVGGVLTQYPHLLIGIGGHTDNVGPEAYNLQLSQRRAEAVRDYLLRTFPTLAPERIEARGYGESQPLVPNSNATTRTLNRRVEFVVLNPEAAQRSTRMPRQEPAQNGAESREALRQQLRQLIDDELQQLRQESAADTTGGS